MHLSRLAGELVQWSTPAFGFVKLSDAFTTGSSIMPQKRNPDAAELVRGKTGRVLGDFVALATVVKGLVLTYGTDLQEDKERVFDAADTLEGLSLAAMAAMIADLDRPTRKDARRGGRRLSHRHRSGGLGGAGAEEAVPRGPSYRRLDRRRRAEDKGVTLDKLPLADMQSGRTRPSPRMSFEVLSLESSVNSRMSLGGIMPRGSRSNWPTGRRRSEMEACLDCRHVVASGYRAAA